MKKVVLGASLWDFPGFHCAYKTTQAATEQGTEHSFSTTVRWELGGLSESHGQYDMGTQPIFLPWRLGEFSLGKLLKDNLFSPR